MSKLNSSEYAKVPIEENEKSNFQTNVDTTKVYGFGIRHVQLLIFFLCFSMSFLSRGHLGVTIVAMTSLPNNNASTIHEEQNYTVYNATHEIGDNSDNNTQFNKPWTVYMTYDWPKPVQEMVLSSFFLGYSIMMFPISFVCQRWGGKVPFQIAMLINGIVSILTPWLALWGGWKAVCVCRVLQGLSQAGTLPGTQTLLAQWVSDSERATLSSYVYTGSTVGNVVGFQLGGLISAYFGWPVTFWVVGVLCLLVFGLLTVFGASSPLAHKTISEEEKSFILGSRKRDAKKRRAPFKAILTSKPIWGNLATHIGSSVVYVYFFTQIPSYIHHIRGIDVKSSGLLSSLPYLAGFFGSVSYGMLSDYITNKKIVSIKNARRIFNTYSQVGMAVALVCASYATNISVTMICLAVAMSCQMATNTGWLVNQLDLAPNYTGTLMSIGNTLTHAGNVLIPVVVAHVVVDVKNPYQWRIMIFLIAGIAFFSNLVFVFLMSADAQPWNDENFNEPETKELQLETVEGKEEKQSSKNNLNVLTNQ